MLGVHTIKLCTHNVKYSLIFYCAHQFSRYQIFIPGQIMIEEGEVRSNSIQFTPMYRSVFSHTANNLPLEVTNKFNNVENPDTNSSMKRH